MVLCGRGFFISRHSRAGGNPDFEKYHTKWDKLFSVVCCAKFTFRWITACAGMTTLLEQATRTLGQTQHDLEQDQPDHVPLQFVQLFVVPHVGERLGRVGDQA